MSDIFTGIGGLKSIHSLLKGRVNPSRIPVEKSEKLSALNNAELTPKSEKILTSEIRSNDHIYMSGDKDKKIRELIHQRLLCEEAIRLKREIGNFSPVWLSRLS